MPFAWACPQLQRSLFCSSVILSDMCRVSESLYVVIYDETMLWNSTLRDVCVFFFIVSPPGGTAGLGPLICLRDEVAGALQGPRGNRWDSSLVSVFIFIIRPFLFCSIFWFLFGSVVKEPFRGNPLAPGPFIIWITRSHRRGFVNFPPHYHLVSSSPPCFALSQQLV